MRQPFRVVIIGGVPTAALKLDSTSPPVITPVVKEFSDIVPKDCASDKEITGDHIEFTTSIFLEVTPVITDFTNVSHKDNTLILFKDTPMITELVDVISEDLPGKLPPTHIVQHAIKFVLGASFSDLPPHRIDPFKHVELEKQVDELSLEVKQPCFVPINIHFYEDKFWSYIVTKDVDQIMDCTIYC